MEMNTQDYLKKALLDTQEKVRDFMNYADKVEDKELSKCFKEFAKTEGLQAQKLQKQLERFK
jgi:rubrerythrin